MPDRLGKKRMIALALALLAVFALLACDAPAETRNLPVSTVTPALTDTPAPVLTLTVVQTVHNSWTGRLTESVFTEAVEDGESYTVENMTGVWSLTFSVKCNPDGTVAIVTSRPMLSHSTDGVAAESDTFPLPLGTPVRIDEPTLDSVVYYTFTCAVMPTPTPFPDDGSVVQFHDRHIVSNIRRTLHETGRSAFTVAELELILFVELKGADVKDIRELQYLLHMETLTLKNTRVIDLSPIAACERLHTLVLLENERLDITTLPPLPSLSTLSITGNYTEEDIRYLATLLPNCSIVAGTKD